MSGEEALAEMDALALRDAIQRGSISSVELVKACLARVAEREPAVQAFAHLDPDHALSQAKEADRLRESSAPLGPLHGVPVGVKDIIDTRDFPTENGTVIDAGRRPVHDAAVVEELRAAGAIVFGKTVTTELAAFFPGKTRNPHDPNRTPGGSSSGSAAAVAAGMVPLAIGTQTNGSVIRPASFCGVVGFKPTRGLISRYGILAQSPSLDTVGTFARSVEGAALLADALSGYDRRDPGMQRGATLPSDPGLGLLAAARRDHERAPRLAFVRTPVWDKAADEVQSGFAKIAQVLGDAVDTVKLPLTFGRAHGWHRVINLAELAKSYAHYYDRDEARLSERMRGMIDEGRSVSATAYIEAVEGIAELSNELEAIFDEYTAIVTPAAPGEAPLGTETGDPAFNTIWTYCGLPAVTLPLLSGPNGMPVGVQLVGKRNGDGSLLATARWLSDAIAAAR